MLRDFIINISIMISFTFLWHQLFKKRQLKVDSGIDLKVIDGIIAGVFGVLLMNFSLTINDITILDFRHIAVAMVAFYGGLIPAIIATGIVIGGRYLIDVNMSSHVAMIMMILIGLGTGLIGQYVKWSVWKKWTIMLIYAQSIFSAAFFFVTDNYSEVLDAAVLHAIGALAGGYLVLYFARYIRHATDTFYQVQENAMKDPLTNLYNVRSFDRYYNRYLSDYEQSGISLGLMIIDIDYFKSINDNYGHAVGDEILRELAKILSHHSSGTISRNGGEEFTILVQQVTEKEILQQANEICSAIENHSFLLNNQPELQITASIGVAHSDHAPADMLFETADQSLYIAKGAGRNQVCSIENLRQHTHKSSKMKRY
ncbi:diguanylate cyclase [Jeotgalibacillus malaysiensis]|uniref:GGDEF domain-containing protein n=1 Tax=Jeotgalibacillus malaysiensis TaxID=1508404 RepID=UPI00384B4252